MDRLVQIVRCKACVLLRGNVFDTMPPGFTGNLFPPADAAFCEVRERAVINVVPPFIIVH